jgi:hypothetical protein
MNASRGIQTAWNPNKIKLISSCLKQYSITSELELLTNATRIWVTNVYGPNQDEERPSLFQEFKELSELFPFGPWMIGGDFNSVRAPHERSSSQMSPNEYLFNDSLADLLLHEIPLKDRSFTWSNLQNPPILSKLDRVLINPDWDSILPTVRSHPYPGPRRTTILSRSKSSQIFLYQVYSVIVTIGCSSLGSRTWSPQPGSSRNRSATR